MILSYRAGRYASLDTLKSKIRPLLPILYGGSKNVTHRQTHTHTDTHTDRQTDRENENKRHPSVSFVARWVVV